MEEDQDLKLVSQKNDGETRFSYKSTHKDQPSGWRSKHYKEDKCRGWRRKLDRMVHHRRRQRVREALARGDDQPVLHRIVAGSTWDRQDRILSTKQVAGYRY